MNTVYKYIEMNEYEKKPKTRVFEVMNRKSGGWLGQIKWYGAWRQYCFFPASDTVFHDGCMLDIVDFIHQLEAAKGESE